MNELGRNRAAFLYNAYDNIVQARRRCKGLRTSHIWSIGILGNYEGFGMTALGRLLGINSHTLTSRMRGIIRKDLAYSDKGKIYLTDKGREVFEILEKGFAEGLDLFLKAALKDYVTRSGGIVSEDSEEYKKTPLG